MEILDVILKALKTGHKILIAGNGGLAAESDHFAAELIGKYHRDSYGSCISLASNGSVITALANDMGYDEVFAHQIKVLGQEGDIFIGMTTSMSSNIIFALWEAHNKCLATILLAPIHFDADYHIRLEGETVSQKQEHAIRELHNLARQIKEGLC